ncbi:MAG: hypothetical protein ACT4QB_24165 [Gammaproteobacteria bacterium]
MSRSYSASGLLRALLAVALLGPMAGSAQDRCDAPSVAKDVRRATLAARLPLGNTVFVLGDSVLLGTKDIMPAALSGWVVRFDAKGSRRLSQGIHVLRARRAEIGRVVVIQLGNNYIAGEGSYAKQIEEAMQVVNGVDRVVWITVAEKYPNRAAINQAIRAAPARWGRIVVGDWAKIIAAHPEYAYDGLHLKPAGRKAMAALIASKVGLAPSPPD